MSGGHLSRRTGEAGAEPWHSKRDRTVARRMGAERRVAAARQGEAQDAPSNLSWRAKKRKPAQAGFLFLTFTRGRIIIWHRYQRRSALGCPAPCHRVLSRARLKG